MAGGHSRQAEQRQPVGEVDERGPRDQPLARLARSLGGISDPDMHAEPPPELRLPRARRGQRPAGGIDIGAASPRGEHLRPVQRVSVVQVGEVADRRQAAGAPDRVGGAGGPEVHRKHGQPRLRERLVDDLQKAPRRPLRQPRIDGGIDRARRRDRVGDQAMRSRKHDVRAHPVGPLRARAQDRRHPLRQPPLHPPSRHGDDLGVQRICERAREDVGEPVGEGIGPHGPVNMEHRPRGYPGRGRHRPGAQTQKCKFFV